MDDSKVLLQILTELQDLKSGQTRLDTRMDRFESRMDGFERDLKSVKSTVEKTAKQVDILYNWVDGIDLKVKKHADILDSLSVVK